VIRRGAGQEGVRIGRFEPAFSTRERRGRLTEVRVDGTPFVPEFPIAWAHTESDSDGPRAPVQEL
jgi:hypothetical protein